jgi:hypothetical protein
MSEVQNDMFEDEFGTDERPGQRPVLSEEELFTNLVRLNKEINVRKEDIKQLITDCKFHKNDNPQGHDKERVKYIAKSAVTYAAGDYEEKKMEALVFFAQFEDITNYND